MAEVRPERAEMATVNSACATAITKETMHLMSL
jgi:hypothetical protein